MKRIDNYSPRLAPQPVTSSQNALKSPRSKSPSQREVGRQDFKRVRPSRYHILAILAALCNVVITRAYAENESGQLVNITHAYRLTDLGNRSCFLLGGHRPPPPRSNRGYL
ncbi:hypothetical protein PGT21_025253 [Puccinia graminis f. sp. tritici]|uniref:Uncharacterized protein n=1 Tax=Puccinia graminis f. sp. tritici TaxID=56615 RepID=A0A5B0R365_PUCGR|nr:hypothetical protein PGT21_025253 [Puccinia graminis f. sp. tritici]